MRTNPLTLIDFYKADHRRQYPDGTELVYSNLTPRSSRVAGTDEVVFFGLQYFVQEYLIDQWNDGFFRRPKAEVLAQYQRRMDTALGPGAIDVAHIGALHDLGYLPLEIKAVAEGTRVPLKVAMLTMKNTKPDFFWLTNYLETLISCVLWKPCTSATTALTYRRVFDRYADETVGNRDVVGWQGHDFSMRGMSGVEDAIMSGAGHLLSFTGTDSVPAIDFLEAYYDADAERELVGGSVPATEHSVMCMGLKDSEIATFRRLITAVYPAGVVSIVSDTWDFWRVITEFLPRLKADILARDGKVVIRPDSGDPVKIICGDPEAEPGSPAFRGAIDCLWETFGGTITGKGYKLLDSHIGLIYGDSITIERQLLILEQLKQKGFASVNVVLGIGSFTYEYVTRDTFGFAVKATYGQVNGEGRDIFKDPKTDSGTKKSAKGLLCVTEEKGRLVMHDQRTWADEQTGLLQTVFLDGKLVRKQTLAEIRQQLHQHNDL
ncbi:nicotinate phosphoribosyltransferase [Fibrella arboris]|uniref:nicotinate phosphoribosyltransferase n=1 Tax=Fibrella arboris TaxID=3242486 RepID=UPI0035216D78